MTAFARADTSRLGRWWWTVDRWTVAALFALAAFGAVLALAASPAVAERLGLEPFYFARRQVAYLAIALVILFGVSLMPVRTIRRLAVLGCAVSLALVAATLLTGSEIKGARRWISLGGISLQPSEFLKPTFAVASAWLLTVMRTPALGKPLIASGALFALGILLLVMQPDIGMALVLTAVWLSQLFAAGLSLRWGAVIAAVGIAAMAIAYLTLPHVESRIDRFFDPSAGDSYQVDKSLEAFANGGLFGRGPGEGTVKTSLPDAHADFVFAVVGEEFGLLTTLVVVGLFALIVLRSLSRLLQETEPFIVLAGCGLVVQFGLQAVINMGSTLRLMPTKGMTLPLISYGGSSAIAVALCAGMLLALTRRRPVPEPAA